ncbi:MAG: DUF1580 domain-containing protein [Planctomycetota bacterium JB042]
MIELSRETLLTISDAAAKLPGVHVASIYRWAKEGHRGKVLETVRVGARIFTSEEALQRFAAACSGEKEPRKSAPSIPKDLARRLSRRNC